jgi:hypothetical protein
MSSIDFVHFAEGFPSLPAEFPRNGWQTKSLAGSAHTFRIDASGRVARRECDSTDSFYSDSACFSIECTHLDVPGQYLALIVVGGSVASFALQGAGHASIENEGWDMSD